MRRPFAAILGILLLLTVSAAVLLLAGRSQQQRIAILTGFDREAAAVASLIDAARTEKTLIGEIVFGSLAGREMLLASVGPGMTNAAARTQALLDRYPVSLVIVVGTAGGLSDDLEVGDVVIPASWRSHQYGQITPEGFTPFPLSVQPFRQHETVPVAEFAVDAASLALAGRLPDVRVGGLGLSGDVFVSDPAARDRLRGEFGGLIVDMESAAVAQTAYLNGVPFIVIRGISDLAGGASIGDPGLAFTRPAQATRDLIALLP